MLSKFRDAFLSAFSLAQKEFLWTTDPVVRTSAMTSYVFPAIGRYLNLALVCERGADAAYFKWQTVRAVIGPGNAYPPDGSWEILVEHENKYFKSIEEMRVLVRRNSPLSVLITYCPCSADQIDWANRAFGSILGSLGDNAHEFLLIMPSQDPATDPLVSEAQGSRCEPHVEWWNFFKWSAKDAVFTRY